MFPARMNSFKLIFGFVETTYENDFLKILQNFFSSHFNVLSLNERSLIGSAILVWIEIRSRYSTGISDKSLRGFHIVVFLGDDAHLPPVLDNIVYHSKNKSKATYMESLSSRTLNQLLHLKQLFVKET